MPADNEDDGNDDVNVLDVAGLLLDPVSPVPQSAAVCAGYQWR